MSRPPAINPRSETVHVRLVNAEKQALLRLAKRVRQPPSRVIRRLIREAVSGDPDYFDDGLAEIRETHRQLAAVGRNLNQLTKLAHRGEALVPGDIAPDLEALAAQLERLAEQYGSTVARVRARRVTQMTRIKAQGE